VHGSAGRTARDQCPGKVRNSANKSLQSKEPVNGWWPPCTQSQENDSIQGEKKLKKLTLALVISLGGTR